MIPLKLETLLKGRVVEQNRVEYKRGWNPSDTIHTICAFANDMQNVNGGYIVIGIESENGIPVLPPHGIPKEELDTIQQKVYQCCNQIEPRYLPKLEIIDYKREGTFLLYLWCSAGDSGPYQAPVDVLSGKKSGMSAEKTMRYWIRTGSVTSYAKKDEISELFDKFNSVPFDDRVNRTATIGDISRGHLEDFLRKSNSSLANDLRTSTMEDLLLALEVANKTDTDLEIRNIGVLMFGDRPHKFIPGAQIDLVRFHTQDAEAADGFTEMTFTGPLFIQIRDAMNYIKTTVIEEKVVKVPNQMEAERFFSYPYGALEEILVNAAFHKLYRQADPVEIRVYVDHIMILNYPGPAHWIDMEEFIIGKAKARSYRNRRIGEFLKELDLSEKQCTGITKILRELEKNGSPPPEFKTDEGRHYMIVTLRIRDGFESEAKKTVHNSVRSSSDVSNPKDSGELVAMIMQPDTPTDSPPVTPLDTPPVTPQDKVEQILNFCVTPRSRIEIQNLLGLKDKNSFIKVYLTPLVESNRLVMTVPDKPTSRNQKYVTKTLLEHGDGSRLHFA